MQACGSPPKYKNLSILYQMGVIIYFDLLSWFCQPTNG